MRRAIVLCGVTSLIMGFLGALLALTLVTPVVASTLETRIQAERFYITDADGRDRVALRTVPGISAGVAVNDTNGVARISINTGGARTGGINLEAVGLNVNASDGTQIGRLGTINTPEGTVAGMRLALNDRQGTPRIRLTVAEDGTPSIQMLDANGNVTWSAR